MDYSAVIGLGQWPNIDKIKVQWPDGKTQILENIKTNVTLVINYKEASFKQLARAEASPLLQPSKASIPYRHQENPFSDFDYDRLLLHMNSQHGPAAAIADLNADGLDDLYLGGAIGQQGAIYLQKTNGDFTEAKITAFDKDAQYEDVAATFFDVDGDGDKDLYVVSGGSERIRGVSFQDRLYLNQSTGKQLHFVHSTSSLPPSETSGSCVKPFDFDQDGDLDLFVGNRLNPVKYGIPVTSQLLENQEGQLVDVTAARMPQLENLGMITDATWTDVDNDGKTDLVVVGEWMPITLFKNRGEGFQKISYPGLEQTHGLWNTLVSKDLNADGREELLVGNLGLNSRFKASVDQPLQLYINDFDENGTLDLIYAPF